jgi:hypothetical protein
VSYWGNNPEWTRLSSREKAAAMAALEADLVGGKIDIDSARNALGAMINRAARDGVDIGEHVSGKIYQPTIEPAQFQRLRQVLGSPEHRQLMELYDGRTSGREPDWVQGATHFLAPERTMLALEAREPNKYRSWRKWTKYDDAKGEYAGVTLRDRSHAFLAPEGAFSAKFGDGTAPAPGAPGAPGAPVAAAAPGAMPEPGGLGDAPPTPNGGWLAQIQAEAPAPAKPAGGMLGTLFADVDAKAASEPAAGGWLGQLAATFDPPGEPEAPGRRAPELADDNAADLASPKIKRPRVDMKRVAAILQSRARLGT